MNARTRAGSSPPTQPERSRFARLVRLFVGRIFHGGGDSGEGELALSTGLILALLPLPGGFYSIFLFEKYSSLLQWMRHQNVGDPLVAALPDEYFFIAFSMVITGILVVWRWDSLFPDRRDYANLVPLPISTFQIFAANLAAILLLAAVVALDLNLASAILFPLAVADSVESISFFTSFFAIHTFVVVLASLFSFFSILLLMGSLMVLLPYRLFHRLSLYVRVVMVAVLVGILSTSFAVPSLLAQHAQTPLRFLPPVWFLGLCQLLRGVPIPYLREAAKAAPLITIGVVVGSLGAYALSYPRYFVRIPESSEIHAKGVHRLGWVFALLDRTILRSPVQRAGYRFVIRTLFRSQSHALILAASAGLGIVTASQFLFASFGNTESETAGIPSPEILAIPLILSYCILLGGRLAFDIPVEIRANWIFQLCLDKDRHESLPLARSIMLSFVLPWMVLLVLPAYTCLWGWRVGVLVTAVGALWSWMLTEILLVRFRKFPFTCSYPAFRHSAVVLCLSYVMGFFAFVVFTSQLEYRTLRSPSLGLFFPLTAFGFVYAIRRVRNDTPHIDKQIMFEDLPASGFDLLDLQGSLR